MGEPTEPTPKAVVDAAIAALRSGRTKYERISGSPSLRAHVAHRLNVEGCEAITPENVVVTHGASAGLGATILSLVDPDDVVVLPEPTYSLYADQVVMAGGRVRWVPSAASGRPDLTQLEAAMAGSRLVIICNPNNPTGYVLAPDELARIVRLAGEHGAAVMVDEAYRDIVFEGSAFASAAPLIAENPHVVCCGTFSKSFAMTGWRLGWVLADRRLAQDINLVHRTINGPLNTFVQDAAAVALRLPQEHVDLVVKDLQDRRDMVCERLRDIPGVSLEVPRGSFYAFPRLGGSSVEWKARLAEAGVLVRAGSEYGPTGEGHIRISFALETAQLRIGMDRFVDCVEQVLDREPGEETEFPHLVHVTRGSTHG
ncbi:pyridoxal phosphate-dependent aminotransferase [Pseudonocardia ailaonensis]